MSRTSIISHAPNQQLVVIRQDYLAICEGNHCAAALLNVFEYWTNIKSGNSEQSKEHNRILEAGGKDATQDVELWIYKSNPELRAELLGLFAETKIRKSLEYLVRNGLITTRNNPNYGWDRTLQYLFMTDAVIAKLHTVKIMDGKRKKNGSNASKKRDASVKNNGAIPKTTTKTTTEEGKAAHLPAASGSVHLSYPVDFKKWNSDHVAQYHKAHATDLDALIKEWHGGMYATATELPIFDARDAIETFQEITRQGITPEQYPAICEHVRATLSWQKGGIKLGDIRREITSFKAKKPKRKLIYDDPAMDLSTPVEVVPILMQREKIVSAAELVEDAS